MLKLDLHIHSEYSEDGTGSVKEIIKSVQRKGLNGLAITDHNTIKGGLSAIKEAPKDFVVIPGIEISTNDGHVIALNVKEDIKRGLSVEETIDLINDKGGITIIPHLYRSMSGIKEEKLKNNLSKISAIEVFNSCSVSKTNYKISKLAKKLKIGGTGGTDSHIPKYCGLAYTTVDTTDKSIDTIISEIQNKKTWGEGENLPISYRRNRMTKSIRQFFERGLKRI